MLDGNGYLDGSICLFKDDMPAEPGKIQIFYLEGHIVSLGRPVLGFFDVLCLYATAILMESGLLLQAVVTRPFQSRWHRSPHKDCSA